MTIEEAKRRAELYSALAEGKIIQFKQENGEWADLKTDLMCGIVESFRYRIKPEPKYRPFKNQEECWNEMLKHQPFGWLKSKKNERHFSIGSVFWDNDFNDVYVTFAYDGMLSRSSKSVFEDFTFADGAPFGIKEE